MSYEIITFLSNTLGIQIKIGNARNVRQFAQTLNIM